MKIVISVVFFFILCAFTQQPFSIRQVYIFNGTFKMNTPQGAMYETWSAINNNSLKGISYQLKGPKDSLISETVSMVQTRSGVYYNVTVKGEHDGKPVPFKLTSINNKTFTFENADNDFPQKIVYQFIGADSLHAWIEGSDEDPKKRMDFYYKKQ